METLRIALVSDWYMPRRGGVEAAIYSLAKTLREQGHDPIVITHQNRVLRDPPLVSYDDGIPIVRFKLPLRGDDYTISPKAAKLLYRFLKYNGVDLVHGHSVLSPFANIAVHVGKGILGIPTVLTHHSLISSELRVWHSILLKYGVYRADELTAVSRAASRDLEEIVPARKVHVTPNCIDIREWRSVKALELEGDPVLLYVARLIPRKNPVLAIKAYESVVREKPSASLYIVGGGPLEREIKEYVEKKGLRRVSLVGPVDRYIVGGYMAGSDLFLATGCREAFSLASLEAMALGLPVIGFSGTGVEDLVTDGFNGFLASTESEFIEKTRILSLDEDLRLIFSRRSLMVSERYDCGNVYPRYLEVYRSALEKCSREKRFFLYRLYRLVRMDPVKPGEWCEYRRRYYEGLQAQEGDIPYIRRRARRSSIPVSKRSRY